VRREPRQIRAVEGDGDYAAAPWLSHVASMHEREDFDQCGRSGAGFLVFAAVGNSHFVM